MKFTMDQWNYDYKKMICKQWKTYVVAERFIRKLKKKIIKCITSISKTVNIYKLDDIVVKYNNTYQWPIKMKPTNVNTGTCFHFAVENNDEDTKSKVAGWVKISKCKNIFAKSCTPNP